MAVTGPAWLGRRALKLQEHRSLAQTEGTALRIVKVVVVLGWR